MNSIRTLIKTLHKISVYMDYSHRSSKLLFFSNFWQFFFLKICKIWDVEKNFSCKGGFVLPDSLNNDFVLSPNSWRRNILNSSFYISEPKRILLTFLVHSKTISSFNITLKICNTPTKKHDITSKTNKYRPIYKCHRSKELKISKNFFKKVRGSKNCEPLIWINK